MASEDLKQHINSTTDFYELLGVSSQSSDSELRSAYRKTALKYHPDKVGPSNTAALEKFHLLQIAYDVLSDASVKELYDNARRAQEEKKEREQAYTGKRKVMKEELEARERAVGKRKREVDDEEARFERELARLAEDGKRRRLERQEELRREAAAFEREEQERREGVPVAQAAAPPVQDADRSVSLRFPANEKTKKLDRERVVELFGRFGEVEDAILKETRLKPPGSKHREPYLRGVVVFKSVVGAHAAVSDFEKARREDDRFADMEEINWASGSEPAFIPSPAAPDGKTTKAPSFGSFKRGATKLKSTSGTAGAPSADELTMMRLKNAQKKRMEEKLRQEEAAGVSQGKDSG